MILPAGEVMEYLKLKFIEGLEIVKLSEKLMSILMFECPFKGFYNFAISFSSALFNFFEMGTKMRCNAVYLNLPLLKYADDCPRIHCYASIQHTHDCGKTFFIYGLTKNTFRNLGQLYIPVYVGVYVGVSYARRCVLCT